MPCKAAQTALLRSGLHRQQDAAAEDDIRVLTQTVEDCGLASCNGPLGFVEKDGEGLFSRGRDEAGLGFLTVTDLDAAPERRCRDLAADPVGIRHGCLTAEEGLAGTDDDSVPDRIDGHNIEREIGLVQSQVLMLADGVVNDAFVPADGPAFQVEEGAGFRFAGKDSAYGFRVTAVGDKTDVLAVPFMGIEETAFFRDFTGMGLFVSAQGETGMGQLFLCQVVEYVTLVLFRIFGPEQFVFSVPLPDPGIRSQPSSRARS